MYYLSAFFYYFLLIPISRLPFGVLYAIADGLSWFFFNVVGYRKKVVVENIRNSFPEKSETEVQQIARDFYTHLCTLIIETIKAFGMTRQEFMQRVSFTGLELLDQYAKQGKSIIIAAGHCHNYEWLVTGIDPLVKHKVMALYRPLNNRFFDEKIKQSRSKLGLNLASIYEIKSQFGEQVVEQPVAAAFAMDQSPSNPESAYWMQFLNQDTPILFGTEKYAKEYDLPVVFGHIHSKKRGYYYANFELLTETPRETAYGEITEKMMKWLEADIRQEPATWLWSHKRWKHKRTTAQSPLSEE